MCIIVGPTVITCQHLSTLTTTYYKSAVSMASHTHHKIAFILAGTQELEDALLLDHTPSPSPLLVELFCIFLNGIVDKDIT